MLCAAVVCPHPPLLVPEVAAGAAAELDALRAACDEALTVGLATRPDRVVLVGTGPVTGAVAPGATGCLAAYGVAGPPVDATSLPLSLTIGTWLLDRAAWVGPRAAHAVAIDESRANCATLGADLVAGADRVALLVLGDASARRSLGAPGHLDPRAEPFDAAVAAALAAGDPDALLALDPDLAADLLAAGRAPWQVLAGAAAATRFSGRLSFDAAPYGVGYLVATWPPDPT